MLLFQGRKSSWGNASFLALCLVCVHSHLSTWYQGKPEEAQRPHSAQESGNSGKEG